MVIPRRLIFSIVAAVFMITPVLRAQSPAPLRLVDAPTAGVLPGRSYLVESHLFDGGGVVQSVAVGLSDLVEIGCSYGGSGVIGAGRVNWQPHVAFRARIRVIEESAGSPALALGIDTQGYGPYARGKKLNRFRMKSRGAYLVISRNYSFFGDLGLHGGVNYSFESDDGDRDPCFWAGADKNLGRGFECFTEYDFATNDNENKSMTSRRGYLNAAVKWRFGGAFTLEFDVKNILRNAKKDIAGIVDKRPEPSRELRFTYQRSF